VPGTVDLYVTVSHSGVTLAPILGEHVTAVLDGQHVEELTPYRPDRFVA
jgi:glycine/D-amino acid oxidase-like deaminating enzyme